MRRVTAGNRCLVHETACSTAYVKRACRCESCVAWKRASKGRPPVRMPAPTPRRHAAPTVAAASVAGASGPSRPAASLLSARPARLTVRDLMPSPRPLVVARRPAAPARPAPPPRPQQLPHAVVRGELLPAEQDRAGAHPVSGDWQRWYTPTGTVRLGCGHLARMTGRQPAGAATLCPQCGSWRRVEAVLGP